MRLPGLRPIAAAVLFASVVGAVSQATAQESGQRDLIRVRQRAAAEPKLRINARGHTATVQALAFTPDSKRLCSAGLDKVVQVWNLGALGRDLRRTFLRERTIRWQVARGLRGSIYALASAPSDGLLAFGGYGATGALGEIVVVNPTDGSLVEVLHAPEKKDADGQTVYHTEAVYHRQSVCSLAFSGDGDWLASMDTAGQSILWKRGQWKPLKLYPPDEKTFDAERARLIQQQPKVRPIVFVGSSHVILPLFVGTQERPLWKLARIGIADRKDFHAMDTVHHGIVTALAVSRDGLKMASADLQGNLYLWDLSGDGRVAKRLEPGGVVLSAVFSPDGKTLVAGTTRDRVTQKSQLQVWDLGAQTITRRVVLPDHVHACAISPDGKRLAYTGGDHNEVAVEPLDAPQRKAALRGKSRRVLKVAFAKSDPIYRIALGTELDNRGFNNYALLQQTFDLTRLELGSGPAPRPEDWIAVNPKQGRWSARRAPDGSLEILRDNRASGSIRGISGERGSVQSFCWILGPDGKPTAVAIGTDGDNGIYVHRLDPAKKFPLVRHFRGHQDEVKSLGVSADRRYLVSGSGDGTVCVWSLADSQQESARLSRWGVDLRLRKEPKEQLFVAAINPAGPLFRRGVRQGDVVTKIIWADGAEEHFDAAPTTIYQGLWKAPWDKEVVFQTSRDDKARPDFQSLPAWQPLATLFVSAERDWALWTPDGYYDASANGYTFFGWQVNRGIERLPDFYRADQFYKNLERPDVLERLLPAGSLHEAFAAAQQKVPGELHETVTGQIAVTPRVEILSPRAGALIRPNSTSVRARISMPAASRLVRAKVFANGVVATNEKLVESREVEKGTELTYDWTVSLPSDQRNLIQLVVGTDANTTALGHVVIERPEEAPDELLRTPRLFVLAAGLNQYGDSNIQALQYSIADAEALADALESRSAGSYTVAKPELLFDRDVTPENWRQALKAARDKLVDTAEPDDLLVLFLAGHGVVDAQSGRYYFIGHDMTLADYIARKYTSCISWDDFRILADVPCRKLALLDTCHSGAIQPLRSRDLKAAIRALQEDVVFTVTASTGDEKSEENDAWRHGAFTKCLLEALAGRGDTSGDGVVTLNEAIAHLKHAVPELTDGRQHPTAAPDDLLTFTSLPLTRVRPAPTPEKGGVDE